jgi:hypothetical protein
VAARGSSTEGVVAVVDLGVDWFPKSKTKVTLDRCVGSPNWPVRSRSRLEGEDFGLFVAYLGSLEFPSVSVPSPVDSGAIRDFAGFLRNCWSVLTDFRTAACLMMCWLMQVVAQFDLRFAKFGAVVTLDLCSGSQDWLVGQSCFQQGYTYTY